MKGSEVIIGLDIGTTSTKAVLYGPGCVMKGKHEMAYPIIYSHSSWAEQDPTLIFDAVIQAIRNVVEKSGVNVNNIVAIGISSAMHSLIAVDKDGQPLTNSMIWADSRSLTQASYIREHLDGLSIYSRTGTPIHPMSPFSKILWLKEEEPDIFEKAAKFISIKEFVLHKLYNQYVVDYSIASATGMFDISQFNWDKEVLKIVGLQESHLSEVVPPTHILKGMDKDYATAMGIAADTPVVIGSSDGILANVGVGALHEGEVAITIGTSGAVRTVVNKPKVDTLGRTFCYALDKQHWVIGGATNNGGDVLRWLRDAFSCEKTEAAFNNNRMEYDLIIQHAEKVPPGSDGLLFLPYLSGERAPYWNPNARGTFFGIGHHHTKDHFIRAVLEGVIYSIYSVQTLLNEISNPVKVVNASGGFARSALWRQILSDVLGTKVNVPENYDASAQGAAVLALYAIGKWSDLTEVKNWVQINHSHEPNFDHHQTYDQLFTLYTRVYEKLKDEFDLISEFQKKQRS